MRKQLNCPNCGAPITETTCPYCGTVFYDFCAMDSDRPTYIRMNWGGNQTVFKAYMRSADMIYSLDSLMELHIDFVVVEDDDGTLMKRREIK